MIPVIPVGAARALKIVASVGSAYAAFSITRTGLRAMKKRAIDRANDVIDARVRKAKDVTP